MTVNGAGDPDRLGLTIMHEHLFIDLWKDKIPPHNAPATEAVLWDQKLSLQNLHLARQSKPIKDNYILGDEAVAIAEAMEFKKNGGSTIVEVTSIGIGRDPMALRRVANATGMNVVMGTGWYQKAYHPDDIDQRTVEDMAAEIVRDVTVGVGDTGIRSGIIGEVGINGEPLTPNEIKSLQASARASRATGAAISLHRGGAGREKLEVVSILGKEGADMSRVIFGHSDSIAWDMPLMLELLNHGVYIQFDTLGMESTSLFLHPRSHSGDEIMGLARTPQAVEAIPKLIEMGYEDRILLSQDVCTKTQLKRYGGNGYSFILERVLPTLRRKGVTEDQVNSLMVDNPRRVLAFAEPS
jgi:phosphotriesterase-related protein